MEVFYHSQIGGDHQENEDAILIAPHFADSSALICSLADGQGGRPGGAQAAQSCVASCLAKAQTYAPRKLVKTSVWMEIGKYVDDYVSRLPETGYTTLIGIYITPSLTVGVSSGDSAAALILDKKFFLLTEGQYKNPPVGSGGARFIPFAAQLKGNWKLIMVSDGVWKYVGWEAVRQRCLSETSKNLIPNLCHDIMNRNKVLPDDFSMILIES